MYLVFDVGGTFIKYALMTADGDISETDKFPTPTGNNDGVNEFLNSIYDIYTKYKNENIEGIAMSLPGLIDVKNGIVYGGGALKYLDKIAVGRLISEKCDGVRVALENDGKCAALCESWKGNAKDAKNAYVLVLGTGVGGGMIIDHHVHHGDSLAAGEVSYEITNMTRAQSENIAPIETCPVDECFTKYAFMAGLAASTGGLCYKASQVKGLKYYEVKGEDVYRWAMEGDEKIREVLEDWYFEIAKLCINIYTIFNPEIILLGGGISAQPLVIEGVTKYVDKIKKATFILKDIKLGLCKYNNRSNLFGAMMNFNQLYNEKK